MYPAWRSSFDAHIYEGRVIQILLMRTAEEPLAEVTVGVSVLAERCKKANGRAEFWVCGCVYLLSCSANVYIFTGDVIKSRFIFRLICSLQGKL